MKNILERFHSSIIKNSSEATSLLKSNPRISTKKQLSIYVEGYRIRLSGAVRVDYPAFCHYMGSKAEKLIAEFVESERSEFYSLDLYPFKFADFLQGKKIKPEAKELAILESNIQQTFFKPDSEELLPQFLLTLNESQLDNFRLRHRTASEMLAFNYDVEKYLQSFRAGEKPKKITKKKTFIFIVRHNNEVKRHYIQQEEYELLQHLFAGASIDESIARMNSEMVSEMISQWLQKWLMNGFFAA
jgi:hypothetical protein